MKLTEDLTKLKDSLFWQIEAVQAATTREEIAIETAKVPYVIDLSIAILKVLPEE